MHGSFFIGMVLYPPLMKDAKMIRLQVWIDAPQDVVYDLIAKTENLGAWWEAHTEYDVDGQKVIEHTPGPLHDTVRFAVIENEPHERVIWECINTSMRKGTPGCEWPGTQIRFELHERNHFRDAFGEWADAIKGTTVLEFSHIGWPPQSVYMSFCTTAWANALNKLKQVAEARATAQ